MSRPFMTFWGTNIPVIGSAYGASQYSSVHHSMISPSQLQSPLPANERHKQHLEKCTHAKHCVRYTAYPLLVRSVYIWIAQSSAFSICYALHFSYGQQFAPISVSIVPSLRHLSLYLQFRILHLKGSPNSNVFHLNILSSRAQAVAESEVGLLLQTNSAPYCSQQPHCHHKPRGPNLNSTVHKFLSFPSPSKPL